jgi:cytidylate kinase
VAIDGPAGAGKTTVTRAVARELGYLYVDTGAIYRAVALGAERRGVSWGDESAMGALAHELAAADAVKLETTEDGDQRILLSGEDVSTTIRTQHVASGASKVSAIPQVRAALLEMQRKTGEQGGVVLEGRDIGTVVFPDAEAKFFLTASVDVRAGRRLKELGERGHVADLETIRREVAERDQRDSQRAVAPLKQADDAVLVDSSELPVDAVVRLIVGRVKEVERRLRDG